MQKFHARSGHSSGDFYNFLEMEDSLLILSNFPIPLACTLSGLVWLLYLENLPWSNYSEVALIIQGFSGLSDQGWALEAMK